MFKFLSIQDIMVLIQIASKASEFERYMQVGMMQDGRQFEADQWKAAVTAAVEVLAKIDREQPGIVPLPHDGIEWKDRVNETT